MNLNMKNYNPIFMHLEDHTHVRTNTYITNVAVITSLDTGFARIAHISEAVSSLIVQLV